MKAIVQEVLMPASQRSVRILRLDSINSWATGNKYFKLKYTLREAIDQGHATVVSKGGMFSNHLAALADACKYFHLNFIALIRSYGADENNPSIQYLVESGAVIHYLAPDSYRQFSDEMARTQFPEAYFIPEGGLSAEGIRGTSDILHTLSALKPTHIVLAGGTMGTALGVMKSVAPGTKIIIVPAWKGCSTAYVEDLLVKFELTLTCDWELWPDFHFGGFGRFNTALIEFMTSFSSSTGIPLDPVYTGKVAFAVDQKIRAHYFKPTDDVMVIHTGGLQGLIGYRYRFPDQWTAYADAYGHTSI